MANLDRAAVDQFRNESSAAIGSFPPGYIEGFRPVLGKTLSVTVGGGITSVEGQGVRTNETLLTRQMWNSPYTGGTSGLFYYVYLTRDGQFKVDFSKPTFSERYFYYAHPAFGWRVILRLWMDSDEKIKFVSKEFRDTPPTVTVAPDGYVGEADYYCDGENDQIWIKAAIEYASRIELLSGTFTITEPITINKSSWTLFGAGTIVPTQPITIGTGTLIEEVRLQGLTVAAQSTYKDLIVGDTVGSLVLDGITFRMNTGFQADTCSFLSVRNCEFRGIENYIGGGVSLTDSASISVSGNSFKYYGRSGATPYALKCNGCTGTIDGNTFFNSGPIVLDSSSIAAFTVTGNDHQDPALFYDEGDATYGPGVAYGDNTPAVADEWEQTTVTFTHPYDSSVTSYSAYLHGDSDPDVYLSDEAGGYLGYGSQSDGEIVVPVYHDTGATPANTTFKFQGEVLGAWSQTGNDKVIAGGVSEPAICKMTSTRVAFIDSINTDLRAYDFDGTDWAQVGTDLPITGVDFPSLAAMTSSRVAYVDRGNDEIRAYDFDGTDWTLTGNPFSVAGTSTQDIAGLTSTSIAYVDETDYELKTYSFDGTDWTLTGNALDITSYFDGDPFSVIVPLIVVAMTPTRVAIFAQYRGLRAFDWNGTDWTPIADHLAVDQSFSIPGGCALSDKRIAVVWTTTGYVYTYELRYGSWTEIGSVATITSAAYPALAGLGGTRFAFIDTGNADLRTYDLATTWADIDTVTASANGEWEELSLTVDTNADKYDGYRVLADSSEEYYVFRATALQDGVANVAGSVFNIPATASVLLNSYENNSWNRPDSAPETRVTQAAKTLTAKDAGLNFADPTANAITLTMDAPSNTKGLRYRIENRHYGNGLIENGDCESTDEPILTGDSGDANYLIRALFARDSNEAHKGTYTYKITKDVAAGTDAYVFAHNSDSDLHGLTAGQTYTFTCWVYVPTSGGPSSLAEVNLNFFDTTASVRTQVSPTAYDEWQRLSVTYTIPTGTTVMNAYWFFETGAANGEYFYVDDIQLYRHYDVTISGPVENVASLTLSSEGDFAELVSDGDKYILADYRDHGQNTTGEWVRDRFTLEQWNTTSFTLSLTRAGSTTAPYAHVVYFQGLTSAGLAKSYPDLNYKAWGMARQDANVQYHFHIALQPLSTSAIEGLLECVYGYTGTVYLDFHTVGRWR